jgi:hypothetical protein
MSEVVMNGYAGHRPGADGNTAAKSADKKVEGGVNQAPYRGVFLPGITLEFER